MHIALSLKRVILVDISSIGPFLIVAGEVPFRTAELLAMSLSPINLSKES